MFLNDLIQIDLIAEAFYNSDCDIRRRLVNNITSHNERSYTGALIDGAADKVDKLGDNAITYRLSARDTRSYDSFYIFRYQNKIKLALCESKLLRFINGNNPSWDYTEDNGIPHFNKQIENLDKWPNSIAKFYMFMLELGIPSTQQSLDSKGSACIWHEDIIKYRREILPDYTKIWTAQDILMIGAPPFTNLEAIIKSILLCYNGTEIPIDTNQKYLDLNNVDGKSLSIPLPNVPNPNTTIPKFLSNNNIGSYNYYNLG